MKTVSTRSVIATRFANISSRQGSLYFSAFFIGLISGALAFVLKRMIAFTSKLLTKGLEVSDGNLILIILPVIGIVLAAVFQRYLLHTRLSHGVEQLQTSIRKHNYHISPKILFGPMIANTFTLGFGGSAGAEGPIAYTGAAVGSNLGRLFGFNGNRLMLLVGCGAGAGIAGIFTAPVGGVLFTLEVMGMAMTTTSVIALIIACVTAGLTAFACAGFSVNVNFTNHLPFEPVMLVWVLVLGVVCGLFSVYYVFIMDKIRAFLGSIRNHWAKNIVAGLTIGVLVFLFPPLFGEGYGMVADIINNHYDAVVDDSLFYSATQFPWQLILYVFGIITFKAFATSSTNSGGGVAGDFAPTLFAGAVLGLTFALLLNALLPLELPIGMVSFIAMAGVMAGAVQAPLMAMFLVAEMTGAIDLLLPLSLVSAISYGTTRLVGKIGKKL